MNVGRVADPATTAGSVAKDCRADLLKLPDDCSDCMTSGHRLLRVCRAYPFHRTETELERSESVDGPAPKRLGEGGRAVRELRLCKPSCDHQRERQPQGPRGSRFQLKYRKQPHAK
jgi:hypothetical protein